MFSKRLRIIFLPVVLLLLLFLATAFLLSSLAQKPSVQRYVLEQLSKATGYELNMGSVEVSLWGGIAIKAHDFEASSPEGAERIVASTAEIILNTWALIRGRIVPTEISLSSPRIELTTKEGQAPYEPGQLSALGDRFLKRVARLRSVSVLDGRVDIKNSSFKLRNLFVSVFQRRWDRDSLAVSLEGNILSQSDNVPFQLQGTVRKKPVSQEGPSSEITLKLSRLPLTWISWPAVMQVREGMAAADIAFKGTLDEKVWAAGKIVVEDLGFSLVYPEIKKDFSYPRLFLDFESIYSKKVLQISSLKARAPDLSLTAQMDLDLEDSSDPGLDLRIQGPFMPLEAFKKNFPTPLFSEWVENGLFPIITGGEIRLDLFSLNGTISQLGNLHLPENSHRLLMKTTVRDLVLYEHTNFLPFKGVSGEIAIENGGLLLSAIKADFGQSTIRDAAIHIDNIFGDAYVYDISLDGLCNLQDLLRQKEMDILPDGLRRQLREFDSASGVVEGSIRFYHETKWDYPRIVHCELNFRDCLIRHPALRLPLSLDEAGLVTDNGGKSRFWGTGKWGRSEFKGSGFVETSWEAIHAYIVGRADLNEIVGQYYQAQQNPVGFSALAGCRLALTERDDLWSLQGELNMDGVVTETSSFLMDPVGNDDKITFRADFRPGRKIEVRNSTWTFGKSVLELSGFNGLGNNDSYRLRVSTEGLSMEDLGIRYKKSGRTAKGILLGRVEINGSTGDPSSTTVTGVLEARDLSFDLRSLPSPVDDCHFRLEFLGKKTVIHTLEMRIGQSPIHVQGRVSGWDQLKGTLTVNASYLDDSDILFDDTGSASESKEPESNWLASHTDVKIKLDVEKGVWHTMKYGPLKAKCAFRSGDFYIDESRIQMEHGILELRGHVKGREKPESLFSIYIRLSDQPAQEFLSALGVRDKYLEGRLTMEAVLFSRGKDTKGLISGLTGSANVSVEKGKINKSNILVKVLDFMSLQNIFAKRPPDLSKQGLYFETITAHITINNGVLQTDDLIMKSPVFNAAAKGSLDLTREWVDLEMGTQPLGTLDSVVSRLPSVGYLLSGEKETVLIYYFRVKGPISDPEVQYIPLKNLERSVIGIFKRLLLTTEGLFKGMSDLTQEGLKKGVQLPEVAP
jgi:hypothetical protein